ncbi:MAG: hypothetical protein Roseis2KO_05600 [Roseivirga sp.]
MLRALRSNYEVTFLTYAERKKTDQYKAELHQLSDEVIVLPSRYNSNVISRLFFKVLGELYVRFTGLKLSNFVIGSVELTRFRFQSVLHKKSYDAVIFEYWHAHGAIDKTWLGNTPVILDMHNILWQTYKSQNLPSGKRSERALEKYKMYEEKVWQKFDHLIAINHEEASYVKEQVGREKVWYIPMGIDLDQWPEVSDPKNSTPRIAWYGGLASAHNQRDAMRVYNEVMPEVWQKVPDAEFWIIGSKPPAHIAELAEKDSRVTVTGFLDEVAPVLGNIDLVLCPWQGTYGFRSRLVEVMATGTPVITTEDAASGMDFEHGHGILFNNDLKQWPALTIELLDSSEKRSALRKMARQAVETRYSLDVTYNQLPEMIDSVIR